MNVYNEGHVRVDQFKSLAHAIQAALIDLDVTAHNPVQGEAMHKVIAYRALEALEFYDIVNDETLFTIRKDL